MKKVVCFFSVLLCMLPISVSATRGCCSHHGGVAGCSNGRNLCNDGTLSPTCTCSGGTTASSNNTSSSVQYIYGCTDNNALNYNASATKDDGSCIAKINGCMNQEAINYNSSANVADGSCQFKKEISETKTIDYKTKKQKNSKLYTSETNVLTEGVKGEKEVKYSVVVDEKDNIISKEKINEEVISKPIDEVIEVGTKEASTLPVVIWIVSLLFVFLYSNAHKKDSLIINRIASLPTTARVILYIIYIITIILVFIDFLLIIINLIKQDR